MVTTDGLNQFDHVGYAVDDLDSAISIFQSAYGLEVQREFELSQYSLRAVYLHPGLVELVEFTDPELAASRLRGEKIRVDHVAFQVTDIDRRAADLLAAGVRLCAPDGTQISEPIELVGARHLWTIPADGVHVQLIERP